MTRDIAQIKDGDVVLSRDQFDPTGALESKVVTGTFEHTVDSLRVLRIEGDDANVETVRTTDTHPFYVENKGWTAAGELQIGDALQESDGTWQVLLGNDVELHPEGISVYNFTVEGDHTYFVEDGKGAVDAVWVHNTCPKSVNQVVKMIARDQAPSSIDGAHVPRIPFEKPHIHFTDGSALNSDGTWKHGGRALTNAEYAFVQMIGWTLPG